MGSWKKLDQEDRCRINSWIRQTAFSFVILAGVFFYLAGSWQWCWGWVLITILGIFLTAHPLLLIPYNPQVLVERARGLRVPGTKTWDPWLAALASIFWFSSWLVAALDFRFQQAQRFPLALHWLGLAGFTCGLAIFLWAMLSNPFFSEGVRIQSERGHTVCVHGPYRYLRHPGYLGDILAALSAPLLLGSCWAFIPAVFSALAFILRTDLEDKILQSELDGYKTYTHVTKYRLLPGIW